MPVRRVGGDALEDQVPQPSQHGQRADRHAAEDEHRRRTRRRSPSACRGAVRLTTPVSPPT